MAILREAANKKKAIEINKNYNKQQFLLFENKC